MSVTDWFRRLFSSSPPDTRAEDDPLDSELLDHQRERRELLRNDGMSGFAGLEVADAAEDAVEGADLPRDPAP
jgi:hypothetical protein